VLTLKTPQPEAKHLSALACALRYTTVNCFVLLNVLLLFVLLPALLCLSEKFSVEQVKEICSDSDMRNQTQTYENLKIVLLETARRFVIDQPIFTSHQNSGPFRGHDQKEVRAPPRLPTARRAGKGNGSERLELMQNHKMSNRIGYSRWQNQNYVHSFDP
jgi:hypothetical protein